MISLRLSFGGSAPYTEERMIPRTLPHPPDFPMDALIGTIRTLAIVLIGIGLVVGLLSPVKAFKMIARMILMPVAVLFAWTFAVQAWTALHTVTQVLVILLGVPATGATLLFTTRFGRELLASVIGNWLYDCVRVGCGLRAFISFLLLVLLLLLAVIWLLA